MFHIIDDRPELLDVLEEMIEVAGYVSKRFCSAEAYLEYFSSDAFEAPVAILSDYEMTGLTGLELIKKVREKLPYQKAVIVSGTPSPELDQSTRSYLCHLLSKPYHFEKLVTLLESLNACEEDCQNGVDLGQEQCPHGLNYVCPLVSVKS